MSPTEKIDKIRAKLKARRPLPPGVRRAPMTSEQWGQKCRCGHARNMHAGEPMACVDCTTCPRFVLGGAT